MLLATHIAAFIFRLVFFALALAAALATRQKGVAPHLLTFSAVAALFASGSIVAGNINQAAWLAAVFVALIVADTAFYRLVPAQRHLFLPIALLIGIGAAIIFDTYPEAAAKHCAVLVAGCIICTVVALVGKARLAQIAVCYPLLLLLTILLCALPLVPGIGVRQYGALVGIGVLGQTFQTTELAKVTLALALAAYLAANARRVSSLSMRGFLPIATTFSIALGAELMAKDLGTGLVLFSLVASMLVLCTKRAGVVYGTAILAASALLVLFAVNTFDHVPGRLLAWLDPYSDPLGAGYQRIASMEAVANGGLIGTGLHFGKEMHDVFSVFSDCVFVAIVEELGVTGAAIIMISIVGFCTMAANAARLLVKGSLEQNLTVGTTCILAAQSFVILAGVMGVTPLTGVTLPFVSHGGSSLIASFMLVGFIGASLSHVDDATPDTQKTGHLVAIPVGAAAGMAACMLAVLQLQSPLSLCGETSRLLTPGDVMTSDGVVLASFATKDEKANESGFPDDSMAPHLVGQYSNGVVAVLSKADLEPNSVLNLLALPEISEPTVLTIDGEIQQEATNQLAGTVGAIVTMDASTGAVLAMASSPSYNPTESYDSEPGDDVSYLNRATGAQYAPGSTFKIITAAAALECGAADQDSILVGDTMVLGDGHEVVNSGGEELGPISLADALSASSNTAFADLALRMGPDPITEMARKVGFGAAPAGVPNALPSTLSDPVSDYSLAWGAVGQPVVDNAKERGPRATVLQMCSVMATVANGGIRSSPYVVESGPIAESHEARQQAMSPETAVAIMKMLGLSGGPDDARATVVGKTGTAQEGNGTTCWHICAAGGIAVACCIEAGSEDFGATVAKPRAEAVLETALRKKQAEADGTVGSNNGQSRKEVGHVIYHDRE